MIHACIAPHDTPAGIDADVDGDGTADRAVVGDSDVSIYVRRGPCFELFTKVAVGSHIAFVHVVPKSGAGVRDLAIETWLFHGDRQRQTWTWIAGAYSPTGKVEEIPGPRIQASRSSSRRQDAAHLGSLTRHQA